MRVIMLMFDSLNRHMLPPYSSDPTIAPNFKRLAERSLTFDRSYVCSMPCMPARRDLHTGRPNFLHRGWSPLEPFDDSLPELLRQKNVSSHLITDHYHYTEDGGATYHGRYDTWQMHRGQEGDPWIGQVVDPVIPETINQKGRKADWVNRQFVKTEADYSQTKTYDQGLSFIQRNHQDQNWFLQIECFDPHEPFCSPQRFHDMYPDDYHGPLFDWPGYCPVKETPEQVEHCKNNYRALVSMCDHSLGRVLDAMDEHAMWDDTMLIVWTDHGFLLGEHGCWAKGWPPMYEEISHTPFFVWDPRSPQSAGQRRGALVQPSIDLAPTILDYFGLPATPRMLGKNLRPVIERDTAVRQAAIFGQHGHNLNVTDGRYVYIHTPEQKGPLFHYTLMPTTMRAFLPAEQLKKATLHQGFGFTQGIPVLKIPATILPESKVAESGSQRPTCLLFDVQNDPRQQKPLEDEDVRQRLIEQAITLMQQADTPAEQYDRLGLPKPV